MLSEFDGREPLAWQGDFLERNRLQRQYLHTASRYFDPLAAKLAGTAARGGPLLVALNGSQGSGKSTLCDYLVSALAAVHDISAVALSLDDFYLTRAEREALGREVHPLFATRGVPGTHDMSLLTQTIAALCDNETGGDELPVPAFDKSRDDRASAADWTRVALPVQLVLLEGWCLGARSESESVVAHPVNDLERDEDAQGIWRAYSNRCLEEQYEPFYRCVDFWVMLAAPGFEQVLRWRTEQEQKLAAKVDGRGSGLMNDGELRRFVAHFERYTRQCLRDMPAAVNVLMNLDEQRRIESVRGIEANL